MNKIFITGATGFTGIHACAYYINKGYGVYAAVRGHHHPLEEVSSEFCDLMDTESMKETLGKFNLALSFISLLRIIAVVSWEDPISTINTNVIGTLNLLETVKSAVPHATVLITGSVIEYNPCHTPHPNHPYGLSKYIQTLISSCWSSFYDMDIRIAKTSNLIGPGHSNGICSLVAQKCLQYSKGDSVGFHFHNILDRRDFLDVRDAVLAYDCILQKGRENETYVVASGENTYIIRSSERIEEAISE